MCCKGQLEQQDRCSGQDKKGPRGALKVGVTSFIIPKALGYYEVLNGSTRRQKIAPIIFYEDGHNFTRYDKISSLHPRCQKMVDEAEDVTF
jgi:hypothetical protein